MTAQGREAVLERLRVDLLGPDAADEVLEDRPADVYLTGILWPRETRIGGEDIDRLGAGDSGDGDAGEEEEAPLAGMMRPCVAGVSFAVTARERPSVDITATFAIYEPVEEDGGSLRWRRQPITVNLAGVDCGVASQRIPLTAFGSPVEAVVHVRTTSWAARGARLVTASLINFAVPSELRRNEIEKVTLFQTGLTVRPGAETSLIPRPTRRAEVDEDDRSAALLYRGAHEFAAGHTCAATWETSRNGDAVWIATDWIPSALVPAVDPDGHQVFESLRDGPQKPLLAEWLADAADLDLAKALARLPAAYRNWIVIQRRHGEQLPAGAMRDTALRHLVECQLVADRMEDGARQISGDPDLAAAFRLANRAMAIQQSWSQAAMGLKPEEQIPLVWRPFQLGFLLLSAASTVNPADPHRLVMDLLWFPTGGGKTEAYLALIAFLAFSRRLRNPNGGGGVAALMRYTLRLLTTQQFARASAMILACEAIRRGRVQARDGHRNLGTTQFGVGLWVGSGATPNTLEEAAAALEAGVGPTPIQLAGCPACSRGLRWTVRRSKGRPTAIEARCLNSECSLHDPAAPLPVYTVDEEIYRVKPTLLIGTVDKFAQIVRRKEIGPLFNVGGAAPPDLVIQDELHLISGPLGSLVGLYEVAIDRMLWRDGRPPKVIGSTATIRRAADQVTALFRRMTCQFPPQAIDASDSGFAVPAEHQPGRLYAAVTTTGRSAKFTLQAVAGSLLQSGAGAFSDNKARDPYWTLVGYFNALRELGGALVLMQDDVPDSVNLFARRRHEQPRSVAAVEELTSRRTQEEVRQMLDLMAAAAGRDDALDAVLATNMLSVGVDIPRLGLMLVNGQPKGIAEYIQATSRVGRRHPGLVVTVLNNAKARDRSHFETFRTWHATLYRDVEATSVTPFASRARDRALHAAIAALARHLVPGLSELPALDAARAAQVEALIPEIVARAADIDPSETAVATELHRFIQYWRNRSPAKWWSDAHPGRSLLISAESAAAARAVGRGASGAIPTPNSMRSVEPGVPFRMVERLAGTYSGGRPNADDDA